MTKKCGVVNCKGNYDKANKCRVFRLPIHEVDKQKWLNVLPPREGFVVDPSNFFICEKHWPSDTQMVKVPGGHTRPVDPPSIFNVPTSCLPSPKPAPRPPKTEDLQLNYFLNKDKIASLHEFTPEKDLYKLYPNLLISRSQAKFVCMFMEEDYSECSISIIVHNKPTLCSPLTLFAFKNGIRVPLGKILNPNNGLYSYSQFIAVVNAVVNHIHTVDDTVRKVTRCLEKVQKREEEEFPVSVGKARRLKFMIRQLQLFCDKNFTVSDYCFAVESYPRCSYDQLRDFLVLPSKRKLQSVISSIDIDKVLGETFEKVTSLQKHCMLLVDEVKIRPTVAFSGGVLNGMAQNKPECKASSMLCVMAKCLHGGPSVMISVTPVHKLTALYQFTVVKKAASVIEKSGGVVLGSITDNHKINQNYCKLFKRKEDWEGEHPLDSTRQWFLLYDNVHILKCIRNNWITEKMQKISFDKNIVGNFGDVKDLYKSEKDGILKSTPLTCSAVNPSKLQLQNVQHVLAVFNDRVVAALKLRGANNTAEFIQQVINWWNVVNVSEKGQDKRLRDPNRSVQQESSTTLQSLLTLFKQTESEHGPKRIQCLTHDTRRALLQTTEGLIAVCKHLFSLGFQYVLLRELQSDRIEGEFSVYRQSTGANAFMQAGDVCYAFKQRLTRFAASFLESLDSDTSNIQSHICSGVDFDDAKIIEICVNTTLSPNEWNACAYVAGWLETKCHDTSFPEDEPLLSDDTKMFIEEVSRGGLTVPHACTFELVKTGLSYVKKSTYEVCCRNKLMEVLSIINMYFDFGDFPKQLFRRLANVLLHGLHKLEKDSQRNATLYQTSIKKARLAD